MKVLSLNLCAFWTTPSKERRQIVADFVKENEVDVLLVQEGIRSCFVYNTIRKIAGLLGYNHYSKSAFGFPFFYEFQVGVISRFPILWTSSLSCEVPQNEWTDDIPLPWRKRVVAVTVDVAELGRITLISVHLTSSPKTVGDKAKQLAMVSDWKSSLSARDVTVYGGDFNTGFDSYPNETGYGVCPDYIFLEGAKIVNRQTVLTGKIVTDHACGIMVEVGK
jgi:endonuclease/exonuclease/phosphatase family metal-dependent hydrolase